MKGKISSKTSSHKGVETQISKSDNETLAVQFSVQGIKKGRIGNQSDLIQSDTHEPSNH